MYYIARWYDPTIARFAQADSIVPRGLQGWDRYAYVNNAPTTYADPTGHRVACGAYVPDCKNDPAPPPPADDPATGGSGENGSGEDGAPGLPADWWIPTEFGWRDQLEGCVKSPIPLGFCGTIALNVIYNRSSGVIIPYVDWSVAPGLGIGGGASATSGPLLGWFASDTSNVESGPSYSLSGTLANEGAASVTINSPLIADEKYGTVPLLFYGGAGGGGFYGGGGVGYGGSLLWATVPRDALFTP